MRRLLMFMAAMAGACNGHGQSLENRGSVPEKTAPRVVRVTLAKPANDAATTRFATDTPKIRAIWKGQHLKVGDKLHAVWIADDVGGTAPKHTTITESDVTAYKPDDDGVFALGKPGEGWPPGKYRVEIHLNGGLITSQSFVIERGATVEVNKTPGGPAQASEPPQPEPSPAVQPKQ